MKKLVTMLALVRTAPLMMETNAALAETEKAKQVVYPFNKADMNAIKAGLRNATNRVNSLSGLETAIEIVVHGRGIAMMIGALKDQQLGAAIDNTKANGVDFKVCANTMPGRNLQVSDLYYTANRMPVPSGVACLADQQMAGRAYIHP
ncbi:DsrE family protein [Guyparkeria sp. 1SP6A2]|nr:DsrE family protein [Guyparkeria sp. 1SP6A2]